MKFWREVQQAITLRTVNRITGARGSQSRAEDKEASIKRVIENKPDYQPVRSISLLCPGPEWYVEHAINPCRKRLYQVALLALALAPYSLCVASEWKTRVSAGAFSSVGEYGAQKDTRLTAIPTSVRVRNDTWGVKLTVPWVLVDGPGNLRGGDVTGGEMSVSNENSEGLGDATLDLLYSQHWASWYADWTLRTKFPTADENEGLGTGATDYELRLDLVQRWDVVTGFGHVAYRQRGQDQHHSLRNTPGASVGLQREMSADGVPTHPVRYLYGGFVEVRRAAREGREPLKDVFGFLTAKFNSQWRGSLLFSRGFSESSADWGIGTQISYEY